MKLCSDKKVLGVQTFCVQLQATCPEVMSQPLVGGQLIYHTS